MAENPETPPHDADEADEALKKRLLARIAVAGVVVVALLGGLAVIDALQQPAPETPAPVAKLEPEEKAAAEAKPDARPEEKPEEKADAKPEASADEKAGQSAGDKPAALAEAAKEVQPAQPEVAAEPERTTSVVAPPRPARPLTVPATPRNAVMKPAEPVTAPRKPAPDAAITRTPPPQSPLVRHAPASRPLTQAGEATRQFVVQMGVFNNLANAEEFRAKLEQAGLPALIEARVQVGPFSTRQEADAAREKLRALGLETGILTAIKR